MAVMMGYLFWFTLLSVGTFSNAETTQLTIANGDILGRITQTIYNKTKMYLFQGIPYAETPERFQMAKPKLPWTGVINCTYDKPQCVQGSFPVTGSEDCLTLDVYSPDLSGIRPVVVWFHGGYFTQYNGSWEYVSGDFFVDENVVYVAVQYRLGIFGFFSTGDLACPGNLGLKDQALALQWVKENIKYFGGDPNHVTLGGQSAGSVAVSLHLQSTKSKGLFQGAIMNSGTSLVQWSNIGRSNHTALGMRILCPLATTSESLVSCLQKTNSSILQFVSFIVSTLVLLENPLAGLWYGYVEEPDHPDAFYTGLSEQQLSAGAFTQVPVLMGFCSNEALFLGSAVDIARVYFPTYDLDLSRLAPADLSTDTSVRAKAGAAIRQYFFGNTWLTFADKNAIYRFISSDQFERAVWQSALDISKYVSSTYFYQFSYLGPIGSTGQRNIQGVGHGVDLDYFFYRLGENLTPEDTLMRYRLLRFWTNFIKNWNPTPVPDPLLNNLTWPKIRNGNTETFHYMNLNSTLEVLTNPKNDSIQFWKEIYAKYGQASYGTY